MPYKLNKDVLIYLIFEPRAIVLSPSDLPCCIIGPLHHVLLDYYAGEYSGNETYLMVPNYDPNVDEILDRKKVSPYASPYLNPNGVLRNSRCGYDFKIEILNKADNQKYELLSFPNLYQLETIGPIEVASIIFDEDVGRFTLPANLGIKLSDSLPCSCEREGNSPFYTITINISGIDLTKILMIDDISYVRKNNILYKAKVSQILAPNKVKVYCEEDIANGNACQFFRALIGKIFISYNVFTKKYANQIFEITSSDAIKEIEAPTPYNPLLLAASIALQNCNGKIFYLVATPSYDDDGYGSALETIKQSRYRLYNLCILTQSPGAIAQLVAHVNERSEPKRGEWRRCFINREFLENPKMIVSGVGSRDSANFFKFNIPDIDLIEKGVSVQDKLEFKINNTLYKFTIAVVANHHVIVTSELPNVANIEFEIKRYYSKKEEADYWVNLAASYSNPRVNLVEPDKCEIIFNGEKYIVYGYFLAVAKAALASGILPSWPLAYRSLSGFYRLIHSNDYFDADLIDYMAERGVDIIVQEQEGVPPFSRMARTTDVSNLTKAIQSIISAADYTAYFFLDNLKTYVGKYNITKDLLSLIKSVCGICLNTLIARGLSDYSIIDLGSKVVDVRQDPDMPTHLIVELDIQPYWPCEKIRVYVYV